MASFSCPSPYILNTSLGLCVEPTPAGFVFLNGQFVRKCPVGMTMNDLGVCIRPVMTRKTFISDASIQQTQVALGANSVDGTNAVVFGSYDPAAFDVTFQESQGFGAPVTQVQVSEGSTNTFLVGQENFVASSSTSSSQLFLALNTATIKTKNNQPVTSQGTTEAVPSALDSLPSSVRKMYYSSSGQANGQMYFLGDPSTKVFLAEYNASLVADGAKPSFTFLPEPYSVSGMTDPYYVGSYPFPIVDNGALEHSFVGALQNGTTDATGNPSSQPPPLNSSQVMSSDAASSQEKCPGDIYLPNAPIDPIPRLFYTISDATSRAFQRDILETSYGYIVAGYTGSSTSSTAKAFAVRYLQPGQGPNYDNCTLQSPLPQRPLIQALTDIQLPLLYSTDVSKDVRVARFDVSADTSANRDTLYVFGSTNTSTGPILSFISENHSYTNNYFFYMAIGPSVPTVTPQDLDPKINNGPLNVNGTTLLSQFVPTGDLESIYDNFVGALNNQLINQNTGVSLKVNKLNPSRLTIDFQTNPENLVVSVAFIPGGTLGGYDMSSTAYSLGFEPSSTAWYSMSPNLGPLIAPQNGNADEPQNALLFNGLSTDDNSAIGTGQAAAQRTATLVTGTNGDLNGLVLEGWSFDPIGQALAFAIGESDSQVGAEEGATQNYIRTPTIFTTSSPSEYQVPANCIGLEVHLWGAGGSCDAAGTGGSGAYVSGHLDLLKLGITGSTALKIIVGSGGLGTQGSGGSGTNLHGKGGGRSAIQLRNQDIVTAGGGGGSSGSGQGGAASAFGTAESGLPALNGGQGATPKGPGLGGVVFGDPRFRRAPDGTQFRGGPNCSSLYKSCFGAGGGGAGFFGGGSGAYLGNNSPHDKPTGSGGGSSFSDFLINPVLISGTRAEAPKFSIQSKYSSLVPSGVSAGGSKSSTYGSDGFVLIISTVPSSGGLGSSYNAVGSSFDSQVWACKPKAFSIMSDAKLWGTPSLNASDYVAANWSSLFTSLKPLNRNPIQCMFCGLEGLVVLVQDSASGGSVQVSWTIVNDSEVGTSFQLLDNEANPFGRLNYLSTDGLTSFVVPEMTFVSSIRQTSQSSRDLLFVGSGARIVTAPSTLNGSWLNTRFVMDSSTNLPLRMNFTDSHYNDNDQGIDVVGQPESFDVTTMHKTPWTPQFASFYEGSDVVVEVVDLRPWSFAGALGSVNQTYTNETQNIFTVNGVGPVLQQTTAGWTRYPLGLYVGLPQQPPSCIIVVRLYEENDMANSVVDRTALNLYLGSSDSSMTIGILAQRLQYALQGFINFCLSIDPSIGEPEVSVFVGPFGILDITIVNLSRPLVFELSFSTEDNNVPWNWQTLFNGQGIQSINEDQASAALSSAGSLLGFTGIVSSETSQSSGGSISSGDIAFETSFQGTAGVQLVPTNQSNKGALTPLSLALPVNSTFAGSIYHVYAPTVKLAVVDQTYQIVNATSLESRPMWPYGLVAAAGGPIASVISTTQTNASDDSFLDQPVPNPGSQYWIDYVQDQNQSWSWKYADCTTESIEWLPLTETFLMTKPNFRSPANILVSQDSGSSYGYPESLFGAYKKNKNQFFSSFYAQTALDSFHIYKNGAAFGCGPAKFVSLQNASSGGRTGLLNAAVSQFNDIKFVPYVQQYQDSNLPGFFIAVGQFLWELNSLVSATWDTSLNTLYGVAWVSLDGLCWTTMPIVPQGAKGENFWQIFRFDYVDTTNDFATIISDIGMYVVSVPNIMNNIVSLFTNGPILDFKAASRDSSKRIDAVPIGLTGPFAAICTSRDATGSCIKCLQPTDNSPAAWPVSVPQIIGAGGAIQPNFDTCISNVRGDLLTKLPYTSVESAVDAFAIAAYAGFDKSSKISAYRQSFFSESLFGPSNDSLIICPKLTDVNQTPSSAGDEGIADLMQCALDNGMVDQAATYQNVNGPIIVRKSGSLSSRDISYFGGLSLTNTNAQNWASSYVRESRWLTLMPYDAKLNTDLSRLVPDTCPSTLGIGGSAIESEIPIGSIDAYPPSLSADSRFSATTVDSAGVRLAVTSKITNKGAFPGTNNEPETGPFLQNQSTISSSGSWAPGIAPYDRAVLANDDLQSDFQYASQGTILTFNGIDPAGPTQPAKQTKNPYLFRLSSFEFPYDSQALRSDKTLAITVGRDPQVYEPGFGPLQNYNLKNYPGFARSEYTGALQPWPANPLPEEGLGHWWIRPSVISAQNGITKAQTLDALDGLYQSALGFGTLIFQQQLGFYGTGKNHQGYTWPSGVPTNPSTDPQVATETLFVYDTESKLDSTPQALKYFSGPWTKYVPFQDTAPDAFAMKKDKSNAWAALNLSNSPRAQRAVNSIANVLNLKLFNAPEPRPTAIRGGPNNWKFLVGLNFFRPRNWSFDGFGSLESIGFGVNQQQLSSDQPDSEGKYEFLIPDPFFAPVPMATIAQGDILGIRPTDDEQTVIASALGYSSRPTVLNFIETPSEGSASYARNHVAFHYFTIDTATGTATLDLFLNVTKLIDSTFQWPMLTLQSGVAYDPKSLPNYFESMEATETEKGIVDKILKYNGDPRIGGPLNSFTWSDPAAQTTRSLASMNLQIPGFAVFKSSELIFTVEISSNALKKRVQGLPMIAADYSGSSGYSLLRHTYVLNGFGATQWPQGTLQNTALLMSMNPNATSLFGAESYSRTDCTMALPDVRGFPVSSNFLFAQSVVNLTRSDYNVELDNAGFFTLTGPALNQDLMAQTYPGASQYGSAEYGFGLRVDTDAVKPEICQGPQARPSVSSTTNADLPCDHGYVSMVRTIVDSHDRFTTNPNTKSIDAVPHVGRLTYVTKYVPSILQAYGSTMAYQPMRMLPFGPSNAIGLAQLQGLVVNPQDSELVSYQCVPNPFRIRSTYLIEDVPLGPDTESGAPVSATWLRPPQYGTVNGQLQGSNYWSAFSSTVFDLESPGFWGRMPLPLLNGIGNAFFTTANAPIISEIYNIGPKYPFAGYEGLWDSSKLLLNSSIASAVSFRSSFASLQDYADAAMYDNSSTSNRNVSYNNSLNSQPNVVVGQMLLNLRDAASEIQSPDTSPLMRLELSFMQQNNLATSTNYRGFISMNQFFNTFVYNFSGSYNTVMGSQPGSGPLLVTHAELCTIFKIAFEAWMRNDSNLNLVAASRLPPTNAFNVVFDPLTDRPSFTFNFAGSEPCGMIRLYVPSPLSNWLGLRAVASPMYSVYNDSTYLRYNAFYDYHGNRDYAQNNFIDRLNNRFSDGKNNFWNPYSFLSPWQFSEISAAMFFTMDPQIANGCNTDINNSKNWLLGAGPASPLNWNFNYDSIGSYSMEMIQRCSTPTQVGIFMDSGNFANWAISSTSYFLQDNGNFLLSAGMTSQQVTYPYQGFGNKATTKAGPNGWYSIWKTSSTDSGTQSPSDRLGWAANGWNNAQTTPLYSLYYEQHDYVNGSNSITFTGRSGMAADETHSFTTTAYSLCDISNVSWTTRLAASLKSATYNANCAHWWGLVSSSASNQAAIRTSASFSVHHADCSLSTIFGAGWPKQTVPSAAKFMGSGGAPQTLASSQATNLSSCVYLDSVYVPAIEVPCPYGSDGLISYRRGLTKPANYDSYTSWAGPADPGTQLFSGSPSVDKVAESSINGSTGAFNWNYATRETYGALVPKTGLTKFDGSIPSPFQFSLSGLSAAVPGPSINSWTQPAPPSPASSQGPFPGPSLAQSISDANGLAVFLVSDACFVNVGPTSFNTGGLGQYNRMSLWAFNYSDLFASGSVPQPWLSADRTNLSGLKDSVINNGSFLKSYLRGSPYYMDESYDGSLYSTLGRSLRIGPSQAYQEQPALSCFNGALLQASSSAPVVLILAPASFSPQTKFSSLGLNRVDNLENSFSNSLVYSFTEPYIQAGGPTQTRQTYSLAFTDPAAGPMYTFYGLDNNASASQGPLAIKASRTTTLASGSAQRKTYQDFSGEENSSLAFDIRQLYYSNSLGIAQESNQDPYSPGTSSAKWPLQIAPNFAFQYTTYENPDWNFPSSIASAYLPLAGTWNGDRDSKWAGDSVTGNIKISGAVRQMLPNYDGLSLIAEWTTNGGDFSIDEVTQQGPSFTLYAVDRKCSIAPAIVQNATSQNLLSISEYNLRRPSTVFVVLCDQWRNTIRMSKTLANSQSRITGYGTSGAGALVPTLTYGDGSAFTVDFVDCMGPSDYDSNNAQNSDFYGVCSGTLPSTTSTNSFGLEKSLPALPASQASTWFLTPWSQPSGTSEQVWSPFTGGSFWNTFKGVFDLPDTESDPSLVSFSPNLWWPTYRWGLAATDPNNVWPTSVASNATLQQASQILFTCTDGSIRKLLMPGSGPNSAASAEPFPVTETTNITTFFNNDINAPGGVRAFSYTWPGRLYNLTFFADNWWCTADNCSVWTTAPCLDGFLINDPALVAQFQSSVIKFRPLSANEGHPAKWIAASWPANEAHKFNVMKVINFNGSLALFVGSVDGEYIVINQIGQNFNSSLPNADTIPWLFPNVITDVLASQKTMLYVTDLAILNNNLIVGSSVLPLDPQAGDVEWYKTPTGAQTSPPTPSGPQALPLLALSYSPSFNNGPSLMLTGQHNTWPGTLVDSNVISTVSSVDILSFDTELNARQRMEDFTNKLSADAVGLTGSLQNFGSLGYILSNSSNQIRPSGLKRMVKPQGLSYNDPLVFYENDFAVPNGPDTSISTTAISSFYALQETIGTNLGSIIVSHQHRTEFDKLVSTSLGSSAQVTTFHLGGFDMDPYAQAFFVSSRFDTQEPNSSGYSIDFRLGLKSFQKSLAVNQLPFSSGSMQDNTENWNANYIRSFVQESSNSGPMPMWNRSLAFTFTFGTQLGQLINDTYANAYAATLKQPLNGPLETYKEVIPDFNDLNKFQSMNIRRAAAIPANINIVDMALAESAQAFALTLTGPFGPLAPQVTIIDKSSDQTNLIQLVPSLEYSAYEARFQGPSLMEWNPFELKWYSAGLATHMPDYSTDSVAQEVLRPAGIDSDIWQAAVWDSTDVGPLGPGPVGPNPLRLMLLSADASLGASTLNDDGTLEPVKFTQVFQVRTRESSSNAIVIKPVSRFFSSIDCIAFSPNAVFIGGSQSLQFNQDPGVFIASNGPQACFAWRSGISPSGDDTKANWSFQSLNVPGTITAAKFVGYAWYIATWDPTAQRSDSTDQGQSNLFFASINFTVVTLLDTWTGLNNTLKITSIDSVTPERAICDAAEGFETDPNNPNACVKKCPRGFKAFGTLCVQDCPMPFSETGVPNECQPDAIRARTVSPTLQGMTPLVVGPSKNISEFGSLSNSLPYAQIAYTVFFCVLLLLFLLSFGTRLLKRN